MNQPTNLKLLTHSVRHAAWKKCGIPPVPRQRIAESPGSISSMQTGHVASECVFERPPPKEQNDRGETEGAGAGAHGTYGTYGT